VRFTAIDYQNLTRDKICGFTEQEYGGVSDVSLFTPTLERNIFSSPEYKREQG
jgi:hypothetical protein